MWLLSTRLRAALKTKFHPDDDRKAFQGSWSELLHQVFHLRVQHHILGKCPRLPIRTSGLLTASIIHWHDVCLFSVNIKLWFLILRDPCRCLFVCFLSVVLMWTWITAPAHLLPSARFCLCVDSISVTEGLSWLWGVCTKVSEHSLLSVSLVFGRWPPSSVMNPC